MIIKNMFRDDIDRKINGVVKVDQDTTDVLVQELEEYVITAELKKHFITFFRNYSESFEEPISDIGVWISGFFGSGKSHFLKILSYILANREVQGSKTVERFRRKLEDDPETFRLISDATKGETDTILFNIDIEGSVNKDKTAVLRVFARMFYNHLGYYGADLKIAMLEKYLDGAGKYDEFKQVFASLKGKDWDSQRKAYAFNGKAIKAALVQVLDMSEADADAWFNNKKADDFSIAQLVEDIKEYVDTKPADYRLLFMADEVGQYVGGDTDLLINLQSIVEKVGSECQGKVWVVCTGQEAIDEIIKARENEFSRIQARFKTRLSLSSSSADEVIQERILKKKPDAAEELKDVYSNNDSVLRNIFSFSDAILDIKGYGSANEFARNFPFVPYQFIVMQKVFSEIRKHGNSGKHLSGGERSMLSGFQEAAQKIEMKDEFSLAPFYLFYDTVHTFLESAIRKVIDRCQKAADHGNGIEQQDVNLLKLLYLIRYVDDIPSNLDNLIILMADDIRLDKIVMREQVRESLDRLISQNYVGRIGDTYNFLTDEEQEIQQDINRTVVDTANVVERIGNIIFGDIYTDKKYRYNNKQDFAFNQMVDNMAVSTVNGGVTLRVYTIATDDIDKTDMKMALDSKGQAIIALAELPYFEALENAMKIKKYIKHQSMSMLPKSRQDILRSQSEEANKYERDATAALKKAIEEARFFVDGQKLPLNAGDAKNKINQAMEYLIAHVYSGFDMITKPVNSDAEIMDILAATENYIPGTEPNRDAVAKVFEFLEMQNAKKMTTSMADIQSRYQGIPYGWKELDVAGVVAYLVGRQKVNVKYAGEMILPNNTKLPDMLRKKSEIGKTQVAIHQSPKASQMREAKEILIEYFDVMDVPSDEKGLCTFIVEKFSELQKHYMELLQKYEGRKYPDKKKLEEGLNLVNSVIAKRKDNIALVDAVVNKEEDLFDSKDDLKNLEDFFKTQVALFDSAVRYEEKLRPDLDYIKKDEAMNENLNQIRKIVLIPLDGTKYQYKRIPELNGLMSAVKQAHNKMLEEKRLELKDNVVQCINTIRGVSKYDSRVERLLKDAEKFYEDKRNNIEQCTCLALLDGMLFPMWQYRDDVSNRMEALLRESEKKLDDNVTAEQQPSKTIKTCPRVQVFPTKTLENEEDIDNYLEKVRSNLKQMLNGCDGIKLS